MKKSVIDRQAVARLTLELMKKRYYHFSKKFTLASRVNTKENKNKEDDLLQFQLKSQMITKSAKLTTLLKISFLFPRF